MGEALSCIICQYERLRRKQWEVSVHKIVIYRGHSKEIGIENRYRVTQDGSRFSEREHAFDIDGTGTAVLNNMRVGGSFSNPQSNLERVDLPAPFLPTMEIISALNRCIAFGSQLGAASGRSITPPMRAELRQKWVG